ncbi:polyprenyl synthetase family protein [Cytobacillus sp. Hz8]|uniref:polyprenyl synthetase family protein n=1 Tax=Cytobacillus sp. Hz8 TaxID=3347168 RepID=UPI0035E3364E
MDKGNFNSFAKRHKDKLDQTLQEWCEKLQAPRILKDSMFYSLNAGGKRIRPLLLFATLEAFNEETEKGLLAAAAIEMIHTYSLIHDDLPCMDDDDLRRGKPTNHKVFGDAVATLAGDALLTYGFQLLAEIPVHHADANQKIALIREFAKASGAEGMVGGQVADMEAEEKRMNLEELEYIHIHKTGKILEFSIMAGAILAKANERQMHTLSKFAYHLGLAFQIQDDILDLEGDEEIIGKPVGSDEQNHKMTYPALLSLAGAKEALSTHINQSLALLKETGLKTKLLEEITFLIAHRDH